METETKLLDLLGGINFKVIDIGASVAEFKETIQYNQIQYARMEAMGEQHQKRIEDYLCLVLAEKLQPILMRKFGNSSDTSFHQVLIEMFNLPEVKSDWEEKKQLALAALRSDGLNNQQIIIISNLMDELPGLIISFLIELAGRLKPIPMTIAPRVSSILARMMKEGSYADNTGCN